MNTETLKQALRTEQTDDTTQTATLLSSLSPKALEKKGLAVLNLAQVSLRSSLGGRTILTLGSDKAVGAPELTPCVKVGDIVGLHVQKSMEKLGEAVVTKSGAEIDVAFEEDLEIPETRLCLLKLVNTTTYTRMNWALDHLGDGRLAKLVKGETSPTIERVPLKIDDKSLNQSQREAVEYAVGSDLAVVHGPPGTGKTSTIIEIARQLVARGERVLVCGPSNVSVDNIVERLGLYFKPSQLIRLGHPARLSDTVLRHSLDLVSRTSDSGQIVAEMRSEIDQLLRSLKKTKSKSARRETYASIRDLRRDLKQREKAVVRNLLLGAKIVVATLHTSGSTFLNLVPKPLFGSVIIDEVSQALVPQCLVPLVVDPHIGRLVIAGDNKQLPPTVLSADSQVKVALERTLFDVFEELHPHSKHLLNTQYRFPTELMVFPSAAYYGGALRVEEPVASQRLVNLGYKDESESVLLWIDTLGQCPEQKEDDSLSTLNEGEAEVVASHARKLLENGLEHTQIGVITPYAAQVSAIKALIPEIEVATVDGFQGREKEAIIMSMVRSNPEGDVGFVADERRINVAITRPRRHLCIVGDTETLCHGSLRRWVEWAQEHADIVYLD